MLVELLLMRAGEPISWIASALGLVTAYSIQFWDRARKLPSGPMEPNPWEYSSQVRSDEEVSTPVLISFLSPLRHWLPVE